MRSSAWILILLFTGLAACLFVPDSQATWRDGGVPLTDSQKGAAIAASGISDGSSGAIFVYVACYEGFNRIFAQRINSRGVPRWVDDVVVCTATGDQSNPQLISDGAGGAIVTWQDARNGNLDIYAQRLNSSGAVQWGASGVAVCTAAHDQIDPQIVSDGAGGTIIAWSDNRDWNGNIYAQRVDASGVAQWAGNGTAICVATGGQRTPRLVSDGAGGAVITWRDDRSGNADIYAQRVDALGAVQWPADGAAVCTAPGDQQYPQVTLGGGAGAAIVAWQDGRNGDTDIYAEKVGSSGAAQWAVDGVALCMAAGYQQLPELVPDGAGGAIVSWSDGRGGNTDVYAQRVGASGDMQWTADGVAVCAAGGDQSTPRIVSDGAGGVIATWADGRGWDFDIYGQRVDSLGTPQWAADGVAICTVAGSQSDPRIATDGMGGAIVTWIDGRSGYSDVYAQRIDILGAVRWWDDGSPVHTAASGQYDPQITSDGTGGAIVTWSDSRSGERDIYAQRVNGSGSRGWVADGVAICAASGDQEAPQIASDGFGGAIVVWQDRRGGSSDIYAQRVNASGGLVWAAGGIAICVAAADQTDPQIISDGFGGAIITWVDNRNGTGNIWAQRVSAAGGIQWAAAGIALYTQFFDQLAPRLISDEGGGAIITWEDYRRTSPHEEPDIYAQRISASGAVQWTASGVLIVTAYLDQAAPQLVSDGAGGAIIAWKDMRHGARYEIYAQRIDAAGVVRWVRNGVAICTTYTYHDYPQVASDGAGGAIITWWDMRNEVSAGVFAQRVDALGIARWALDGIPICAAGSVQGSPQVVSDGAGGAIVTWAGGLRGQSDIYAQKASASGVLEWAVGGIVVCDANGSQTDPQLIPDGVGGTIVVWEDGRCIPWIYAQRINGSGRPVATLLQQYAAAPAARGIRISWSLSQMDGDARFSILRASAPDWKFVELEKVVIDKNGLSFACTDESCFPGSTYKYRVVCESSATPRRLLFETEAITIPALPVTLYQNHPNPFNPRTVIRFYLPEAQEIALDVYNVAGARVARLAEGRTEKGYHEVTWDGRNSSGTVCSSGVYFSRLKAGKSTISRKMVIMR